MIGNGSRIVGSADCRTFSDRGPAPTSGGFDTAQLAYYGRGIGSGALVIRLDGKPAGTAVRRSGQSGWQPYVRLDGTVSKPRITPEGAQRSCPSST